MKILHILYSGLGGHGNVFFSMVDADEEHLLEYEVIYFGVEDVRNVYIEKSEVRKMPWYFVKKHAGIDLTAYKKITYIIKLSNPDIIFLHSSSYIVPAKRAVMSANKKIKIIVRETQPNHLKTKQQWVGLSIALLMADKVVFLSEEYKNSIKKALPLFFHEKKIRVIPNGIDLKKFKPLTRNASNIIKIGMQSRISATKDHLTLIRAFDICLKKMGDRNLFLYIAGDGDCMPNLEALVQTLNIKDNIIFTGMLDEKDLNRFINNLDIYVHATLGETMSTAIMQVMACKLPIIASDVLGVNNMIKHNVNGLLVPAGNEEDLAEAIQILIQNDELKNKLATGAYEFAIHNYNNEFMFEKYLNLFNE